MSEEQFNGNILVEGDSNQNGFKIEMNGIAPIYMSTKQFVEYLNKSYLDNKLDSMRSHQDPMGPARFIAKLRDDDDKLHLMEIDFNKDNARMSAQYRDVDAFCKKFNTEKEKNMASVQVNEYCKQFFNKNKKTILKVGATIGLSAVFVAYYFSPTTMVKREIDIHDGTMAGNIGRTISMRQHADSCKLPEGVTLEEQAINYLVNNGKSVEAATKIINEYMHQSKEVHEPGKTK